MMIEINSKYSPIMKSDSRYHIVTGGRGSGKSFSVTLMLLLLTMEKGHTILFTRYTLKSAAISIIPEFIEKIELLKLQDKFYITKDEIINKLTGSKILFRGIKTSSGIQTANLKSLQGVTTWVCDEAEELVDETVFDTIDLSVREMSLQNRVILIMNPTTKVHWIYKRFFESNGVEEGSNTTKDNTTYIHTTYLDNIEFLSPSFLTQLEVMRERRPEKYRNTILGGWLDVAEGVIFNNWTIGKFKIINGESSFGMDFGYSTNGDPTTLTEVSIDKKNKRIYIREHLHKKNLTTSQIYNHVKHIVLNKTVIADSAEGRLIDELKAMGLKGIKRAVKGKITDGIVLMQDYDMIIDEGSINLITELNNYQWASKGEKPIDKWNHQIDGARYNIEYQLVNAHAGTYNLQM